ncbi:hypothetical protein PV326_003067 [Microctonus aethiopoides]|nr:hypothetical protein PV326_003067 [Microctonus aethiopoides]
MHASFPYDGSRGGTGGAGGRSVEYGAVRRPDALLPPPGLDQTDLVLHSSLVDDPQLKILYKSPLKICVEGKLF